ncbi:hypothetical protein GGI15_004033 [Coemansia interrupta]|uniref:Uncharacterized protein n=1 Tax=Coemansia interrupta TaxID=1126814 RepID=A0A9W8LH34_9FUNG|nr:hypothetical protein GGI15_004033 [Coemansia interrupta]
MRKDQSSIEDIHSRVVDIDERFSHMLVEIETLVQSNQVLQDTVDQQSQHLESQSQRLDSQSRQLQSQSQHLASQSQQLESQSQQIQALNQQIQAQNDELRQTTQSLDKILQLVTDIVQATSSGGSDVRRKSRHVPEIPGVQISANKEASLNRTRAIVAKYIPDDLFKACMKLMRHVGSIVTYLCKTERVTLPVVEERGSGRTLGFVCTGTWREHTRENRDNLIYCMEALLYYSFPLTMDPTDLHTAAVCFSEVCISNQRAMELKLYEKLCSQFSNTRASQWPMNVQPPRNTEVLSIDDAGNVVLYRKPSKEPQRSYVSLVGTVPDYNNDAIVMHAKNMVKDYVEIFKAAMDDEMVEANPMAEFAPAGAQGPAEQLSISEAVDSVMDRVMHSVLNTPVDNTMDYAMGNGDDYDNYDDDEDDGDSDS